MYVSCLRFCSLETIYPFILTVPLAPDFVSNARGIAGSDHFVPAVGASSASSMPNPLRNPPPL